MSINATLIGQMITFALLVWFTMKYVWPPLLQAMEARKARIADGLAAAEKGRHELDLAEKRAKTVLKDAKEQAAEIIGSAQKRANEIVEESKQSAKVEGERLVALAKAEIDQQVQQAKDALKEQVAVLALSAAGQILAAEVDEAKHKAILNNLGNQLG